MMAAREGKYSTRCVIERGGTSIDAATTALGMEWANRNAMQPADDEAGGRLRMNGYRAAGAAPSVGRCRGDGRGSSAGGTPTSRRAPLKCFCQ